MTYWNQNNEWYGWKGEELYRQCLRLNGREGEAEDHFADGQDQERVTFSIIHATLGRPEKALAIREMWLSRARFPKNVQYVFGLHDFDPKSIGLLKGFEHTITESKGAAVNYDTAAGIARGEIIIQAQDDCYPPEGWDVALLEIVETPNDPVFVACADGTRTDDLTVCSIMTRAYMDIKADRDPGENGFMHRGYTTVFPDTENSFRAIQDGKEGVCRYVKAPQFAIYHDHPLYNPLVPWDATYEWENCDENYRTGSKLFAQRNPAANSDTFKA
jgi:hypothetical protein